MTDREFSSGRERIRYSLLTLLPKNSVGAEIGVSKGDFSEEILRTVEPKKLVLVDPWNLLAERLGDAANPNRWFENSDTMKALHAGVVDRFKGNKEVKIVRGFSQEELPTFPNSHFDWVYIDASHTYQQVRDELELSIRKVKVGGYITGDDLLKSHNDRKEVRMAVQDVLETSGEKRDIAVLSVDDVPAKVDKPSRLGQQFIFPVTEKMKARFGG
ncbi:class I SAM-dependent methyltransferase [Shimia sagamensis]|uniref:Methyltransferase domain-containing protein n=1 Tax=Shimia sagamensis TaxID=1566352 RepID=A0ABY1PM43_9RHOB|nr:class I SAM-dependent methyltransferase [Shimia sagamensis]SMP35710.1 Methyltransferase domain-containing protein [Shimia sagamensis]